MEQHKPLITIARVNKNEICKILKQQGRKDLMIKT